MTPAHIATILVCAVVALIAGFLLVIWLATRAIDDVKAIWSHDHTRSRVTHIARCSTVPDLTRSEFATMVCVGLAIVALALLSTTWVGQEAVDYVARVMMWQRL